MLTLKYQGRSLSQTKTERLYIETWSGFENEIDSLLIDGITPTIGQFVQNKGYLIGIYKRPAEGSLWELELQFSVSFENTLSTADSTVVGKKSATLTSRTLQLPLEKLTTYKTNWNWYLASMADTVPSFWTTATDTKITGSDASIYCWKKTKEECEFTDEDGDEWTCLKQPTKQGVDYFQFEYYVVTERTKYNSPSAAGSALQKDLNRIRTPQNTFGLVGGNWKLSAGEISYDGKMWIVTNTYEHSPVGWDTDLYGNNANIKPYNN